jgi:PAS domain S-box-containing protein
MLGYTVDEMQGKPLFEFMDERGIEISRRELERRALGGRGQLEFEFRRRDGSPLYALLESSPIFDDDGHYQGAIAGIWDIGLRKQADEALRSARDELEKRVAERTVELACANEQLRAEIDHRRRIEEELRHSEATLDQRVAKRTRELSALLDISNTLTLTSDLEPILNSILDNLQAVVDYESATILEVEGTSLAVMAHRGLDGEQGPLPFASMIQQTAVTSQVMASRQPVIIPDVQDELALPAFPSRSGPMSATAPCPIRSWMGVPLAVHDRTIGLLSLAHTRPHHFAASQAELALTIANQAAVAMQNARLYAQAQALAAMEERQHLARELHDSVTQTLFSAGLVAELLPQMWRRSPEQAMKALQDLRRLTNGALVEMRAMLVELRPAALLKPRLDDLVTQLAEAITGRTGLCVELQLAPMPPLPPDVQITFYRVCQEALHNAVKHAAACRITVGLQASPAAPADGADDWQGQVLLEVADDGRGFDPRLAMPDRLGLRIMRERSESIGACLAVASEPGRGTQVSMAWRSGRRPAGGRDNGASEAFYELEVTA